MRSVNLTHTSSPNCAQRQDTRRDVWKRVWMQWMTQLYPETRHMSRRLEMGLDAVDDSNIFSLPCHALHVPRHVVVLSLPEPLNQIEFFHSVY